MGKAVLAVIVGYLVMFVVVFVSFSLAYLVLGAERSFQPGSYDVSTNWALLSIALGFIAAVLGGMTCARIAPWRGPLLSLCIVLLVFGAFSAIGTAGQEEPGPRGPEVGNLEAMMDARPPAWIAYVNPLVGIAGVLIGGRRALRSRAGAA
jgi:hypothetical protein